tara:strand:+ start:153 stop:1499 length:1347 start_codon:yes stop_codon:yes gene_type:complete
MPLSVRKSLASSPENPYTLYSGTQLNLVATLDLDSTFGIYKAVTSFDGTRIAISDVYSAYNGVKSVGRVDVYDLVDGSFVKKGQSLYGPTIQDSQFGYCLDLSHDGTYLAVGQPYGALNNVRVFELLDNTWTLVGDRINGTINGYFGASLSLSSDGTRIVIGSPGYNSGFGKIQVFDLTCPGNNNPCTWNQTGSDLNITGISNGNSIDLTLSYDGTKLGASNWVKDIFYKQESNLNWSITHQNVAGYTHALSGNGNKFAVHDNDGTMHCNQYVQVYNQSSSLELIGNVSITCIDSFETLGFYLSNLDGDKLTVSSYDYSMTYKYDTDNYIMIANFSNATVLSRNGKRISQYTMCPFCTNFTDGTTNVPNNKIKLYEFVDSTNPSPAPPSPPSDDDDLSPGAIAGITLGSLAGVGLGAAGYMYFRTPDRTMSYVHSNGVRYPEVSEVTL